MKTTLFGFVLAFIIAPAPALKVENQKVTEAEHLYAVIAAPSQLANLQTPRPAFLATVPPAERSKRNSCYSLVTRTTMR